MSSSRVVCFLLAIVCLSVVGCAPDQATISPSPSPDSTAPVAASTAGVSDSSDNSGTDQALRAKLLTASFTAINADPALSGLMTSLAETAIADNCAGCHGATLEGSKGVPSLADYDWIWGITGEEVTTTEPIHKIMQTVLYGIRDRDCPDDTKSYGACPDTRYSEMPSYRQLGLTDPQIQDVVEYVLSLSGQEVDAAAVARAQEHIGACTECHAESGMGYKPYGGPDLTDDIWIYGGTREELFASIADGRMGVCPPWANKLDAATIKALGVYLYRRSMGY